MSHGTRRMRTILSCKGQDCSLQDARSMAQDMLAVCASLPQHQQTNLHKVIDSLDDLISIQQNIVPASRTDQQLGGTQSYLQMDEQLPAGWGNTDDPEAITASPQEPLPQSELHIQGEPMPAAVNQPAVKKERKKDKQQKQQPGETSPVEHNNSAAAQPSSRRKKKREREETQQDGDSKPPTKADDLTENGQLPHAQAEKQSTGEEQQADEVKPSKKAKKSKADGSVFKEVPQEKGSKENKSRKKKKEAGNS